MGALVASLQAQPWGMLTFEFIRLFCHFWSKQNFQKTKRSTQFQMIAVCVYLFPLLMGRADPACALILAQLDWMHLAIFYPLLLRYLRLSQCQSPSSMYLLTESIVASCATRSAHLQIYPALEGLNYRKLARAANKDPNILYLLTLEAVTSKSKKSDCSTCLYTPVFTVYPALYTSLQNSCIEQVVFNPKDDSVFAVVYDDRRTKIHSLNVYKLTEGKSIAEQLLVYREREDFDVAQCDCRKNDLINSFLAASWSPNGAVLAVYETKDRFCVSHSARISLFTLQRNEFGADVMQRIDCDLPAFGRINLLQRCQSFRLHMWQSQSTLLISTSDESESLTSVEISTTSNCAKLTMRSAQRRTQVDPICDFFGVINGRSCIYSELNSRAFPVNHLTPYGYWLVNDSDLITCEQCVVPNHLSHSTMMLKRLGDNREPLAIDTLVFPKHRVHDATVRSDMPNQLLVVIGPSGAAPSLFHSESSVIYSNTSNTYVYKCAAPQPWLQKHKKIPTFVALVSIHSPTLKCEIICQSSLEMAPSSSNHNHPSTLTIMGESTSHIIARECCKSEDYPILPPPRFYLFSLFGGDITILSNDIYIPSPYSEYRIRLNVEKDEKPAKWLSVVLPAYTISACEGERCQHNPTRCLKCKRKKPIADSEIQYPPLKCIIVTK